MGFWGTVGRIGAGVATGGASEVAIRGGKAIKNMVTPPGSPDYMAIAGQEAAANRPDQNTPYASSAWETKPFDEPFPTNGSMHEQAAWLQRKKAWEANPANRQQKVDFAGPLSGANEALMGQAAGNLTTPMDWQQFGKMGTGDEARQQAIDAAYNQATKRLDPAFAQRGDALNTQLMNQGLDPNSQAGRAAAAELAAQRNDAYSSAMSGAIAQGTAAGDSVFRNNLQSRQQAIAEALTQRGQPLSEMRQMQGFLAMPGFAQANMLGAAGMQGNYDMTAWQQRNQAIAGLLQGGAQLGSTIAGMG